MTKSRRFMSLSEGVGWLLLVVLGVPALWAFVTVELADMAVEEATQLEQTKEIEQLQMQYDTLVREIQKVSR